MEDFLDIAIVILILAIPPLRLKIRLMRMKKFARKYDLFYHEKAAPGFFNFYSKMLSGDTKGGMELNLMDGAVGNHHVRIYDKFNVLLTILPGKTIIEIDKNVVGKDNFGMAGYITQHVLDKLPRYLASVQTIQKIFKVLQKKAQ